MIITAPLVILMCLVFVLVFLFVNTIDHRKWLTILVSLALTPIVYFYMLYPMINIFVDYHHKKYFTELAWQESPALRYELTDHMLSSEILDGKSKQDIKALLGAPEWLGWDSIQKQPDNNRWNYGLGIEPGAFNDQKECMVLVFKNDTLEEAIQYQEELEFAKND
ncbi:hypothetical protein [Sediminibacter sp. Hel_I_10]|uniref:hypothetical protein n=1 Tax=Sediminibacter sp. Hel_I_10 TaxID=1392490 RepID=UPI00047AAF90|nr:hypothetical protein [Sediminibacter sp. Hel_I_10]